MLDGIRTLLLFYPLLNEIDLLPVFHYAKERGIACAFPRCGAEKGEMGFYYVENLEDLTEGKYSIREPRADARPVTDLTNAIMLVPALAIDREGHRIGYGGGYYDRYLKSHGIKAIGIAYEEFLVDTLPHEPWDVPVDLIITEDRILNI